MSDHSSMTWPWEGHEECQVYRLMRDGEECGRICKRCMVVEIHLVAESGHIEVELDIEIVPSGSA